MYTDAKLLITRYHKGIFSCILQNNRMIHANFFQEDNSLMGNIYIAKVLNTVPNLNAAFLEYQPGKKCYLSLQNEKPVVLNRNSNGNALASGDLVAIQIIKEAIKTKEPRATTNLSVTGQYVVITSGNTRIGFSDKLTKDEKETVRKYLPQKHKFGIIVRTNVKELMAQNRLQDFEAELEQLTIKMQNLIETAAFRTCYSVLSKAPAPYLTELRDTYHYLYQKIITDDKILYEKITEYMKENMPDDLSKLSLYEDSYSMHKLYSLETKIQEALSAKVWMKSGAYLIIQPTEALVAIDVNSGKNDSKKLPADYILQINKEAAREVVCQLKLRNLSGMILIDFINMPSEYHAEILDYLSEQCRQDQIPTHVIDMTMLGLVEITRKKTKKSLWEQFQEIK